VAREKEMEMDRERAGGEGLRERVGRGRERS
jgi:hypothetical protein